MGNGFPQTLPMVRPDGRSPGPSGRLVPVTSMFDARRGAVPRFYFDVSEGLKRIPDEEGFELDSLEAAEHEATQTLIQLGRDWLPRAREVRIQVRDEQHRQVLALSVAIRVERLPHLLEATWIQEKC
jgi:hypothetical protein